ncbi:UDP-N-acetylglucosamine 1-carboxyvinyltransferase [Idiomarina baltica]|uniref:UDP-N-acetylglucosamine 1-carboxyvinyltransferase n=1 Tax=Idiomarina baltica OS145 TaxID=314276 RepID=A0ABM9WLN9_9GAMM|nr:UDP-N-acetylglucosamine 1-carboxyvinyltransferase [Idiomarina baltica]EAQ31899.1 UDP-N-acetylglucosamine enolpyruvyl transferase [Idiomarina baltica OS145]
MNKLEIKPSRLNGVVKVDGAKNSALRLLAASILTEQQIVLTNYPSKLLDTQIHVGMLEMLGKECNLTSSNSIQIREQGRIQTKLEWQERSIRNTLLILGALVTRFGEGAVPLPGGCKLGERKYDIHVSVLNALGAEVWEDETYLYAKAKQRLKGSDIKLPLRSTGATENAIITATLASGTTRIWNPHVRPEILDLISMLRKMGAKIRVHGQEHIEVCGVGSLSGCEHSVIPDSMEAITWLTAAVTSDGDVEIENFPTKDLEVVLAHVKAAGARIFEGESSVIVRGGRCYPIEISTGPHPGINSDVQPLLAAWATKANGQSKIIDLRFPGRYGYAEEMAKMGLKYRVEGDLLVIDGGASSMVGSEVKALDLRAGAALAICGLFAEGKTVITDAWQISRGYVDFVEKVQRLGGHATWIE